MAKTDTILVVNAGSSSIKFSLYPAAAEDGGVLGGGLIEGIGVQPQFKAKVAGRSAEQRWPEGRGLDHAHFFAFLLDWLADRLPELSVVAAGHRVVHGGPDLAAPVLVEGEVLAALERLVPLAPLHQPPHLPRTPPSPAPSYADPQFPGFPTPFPPP